MHVTPVRSDAALAALEIRHSPTDLRPTTDHFERLGARLCDIFGWTHSGATCTIRQAMHVVQLPPDIGGRRFVGQDRVECTFYYSASEIAGEVCLDPYAS